MSLNSEAITLMLVFGAAWGFVRLMGDAIVGGGIVTGWVYRKLMDWSQ